MHHILLDMTIGSIAWAFLDCKLAACLTEQICISSTNVLRGKLEQVRIETQEESTVSI